MHKNINKASLSTLMASTMGWHNHL